MITIFNLFSTILIVIATIFIIKIYLGIKYRYSYFQRKNIPFLKPSFPLGNTNLSFYRKYGQELEKIHVAFRKQKVDYGGFYIGTQPVFIPIDTVLIRSIISTDFHKFNNRGIYVNEEKEFLTAHLFALSGPPWKKLRTKFSPIFSSSKLRMMVDGMQEKTTNLEVKLQELSNTSTPFDAKDLTGKIMTDITCTTIFGIDCCSVMEPFNEFHFYGRYFFKTNFVDGARMILAITLPKLFEALNFQFVNKKFTKFFVNSITNVVEYREKNAIERPDFMNLLIKMKNNINIEDGKLNESDEECITLKQLLAQCFAYFLGSIETTSTLMSCCIFELTQNQELQNNLREEIHSTLRKYEGKLTYEGITEMKLMEKVVLETLRKYPPFTAIKRVATEDYTIPGTDTVLEKGTAVMISIPGLHHDPEYYPNPEIFDPERFSEDEIAKRPPSSFIPFGEGPKHCIGDRFGLLQAKVGIINMLKNSIFTLNSKTKLPIEFKTETIVLAFSTIWLNVKRI